MAPARIEFAIIEEAGGLGALAPEWQALWDATPDAPLSLGPAHARLCWELVARPAGRRLACVAGRESGRLVLVWPLMRERAGPFRRLLPLSPALTDYSEPLTPPGPERTGRVEALLGFLRARAGADLLHLPYVRECSALAEALAAYPLPAHGDMDAAPLVRWRHAGGAREGWAAYYASLGPASRKVQEKKRRQLDRLGAVEFRVVADPVERRALLAFLFEHKRRWAARTGKSGPWLFAPAYERFLAALADEAGVEPEGAQPGGGAGLLLFVLTLGGEPLAVQVAAVGHRVDWLIAAFHADHQGRSPGVLLNEHCLRWAQARGLDVDMGPGREANKLFWARGEAMPLASWTVAASRWGAARVLALRARRRLGRLRRRLRERRAGDAAGPDDSTGPEAPRPVPA